MNWESIKQIYRHVLVYGNKIEYLGEDRYKIICYYPTGEKHWEAEYKNRQLHGKDIGWHKNGQKSWDQEYENGKQMNWEAIKFIYRHILIYKSKIEYLGGDKYKITYFNPAGEKRWEQEYQNEQRHGKGINWYKYGNKVREVEYKNGVPI